MDLILLIGIAVALLAILIAATFFARRNSAKQSSDGKCCAFRCLHFSLSLSLALTTNDIVSNTIAETAQPRPNRTIRPDTSAAGDAAIPRRAMIARNQRHRATTSAAAAAAANQDSDSDDDDGDGRSNIRVDEKMGAKKRAKLEAKAEKRQQRETEQQMREDKKKRDALIEEERRKDEQREEEIERKREEAERLAREEKERREHEEYLKLKAGFQVEEEGYDECDEDEKENLLRTFIDYIKEHKVVVLEDLATQFKLKTQAAIDRITDLQETGTLTGVIDDQGKFIYISDKELNDIASFIQQRGRVSITELAESSNNLVNLKSNAASTEPVST